MSSSLDTQQRQVAGSESASPEIRGYDPAQDLLGGWPGEPSGYYPGHTLLGKGYHVLTGKYADADSLLGDVIEKQYDWHYWGGPTWRKERVKYCSSPKVDNLVNRTVEHFAVSGSTIDELRQELSMRLGFEGRFL